MHMVAEQAAGTRAPTRISGYSSHALEQTVGRDGAIGVSQSTLSNAWHSPLKIGYVPSRYDLVFRYAGIDALIVVNTEDKVVTVEPKSSSGTGQ